MKVSESEHYGLASVLDEGKREAIIRFTLPEKSVIILKITDSQNKDVRVLINEILAAGNCESFFSFGSLNTGDYFIKLIIQTENIIDINSLTIQIP